MGELPVLRRFSGENSRWLWTARYGNPVSVRSHGPDASFAGRVAHACWRRVWNPANPSQVVELNPMVDTGAAYSWVHRSRLEPLKVPVVRHLQFQTIDGKLVERDLAAVFLSADGYTGGDNVVLAEPNDFEVIGARTLEVLGLIADPSKEKLVPLTGALALTNIVIGEGNK